MKASKNLSVRKLIKRVLKVPASNARAQSQSDNRIVTNATRRYLSAAPVVVAAGAPNEKAEVFRVVRLVDIDRKSVQVSLPADGRGAQLSFVFREKEKVQVRRTFFTGPKRRVRLTDGASTITETEIGGFVEQVAGPKILAGLILSFETMEEAQRVASVLRPSLK